MDQDLFNDASQDQGGNEPSNYLEALVGEGKKFKDIESLAKGKWEADRTLNFKNQEFDRLRNEYLAKDEELKNRMRMEEIIERLSSSNQQSSSDNQNANDQQKQPDLTSAMEEFRKSLPSEFAKYEDDRKQRQNFEMVQDTLRQEYGENSAAVLKQKIQDLDLDADYVNSLARKSPKALFNILGLNQRQREGFQAPPRSQARTDNFAPSTNKRTWTYYENLRTSKPAEYLSPKIQTQMLQDMRELGPAFQDGNWKDI